MKTTQEIIRGIPTSELISTQSDDGLMRFLRAREPYGIMPENEREIRAWAAAEIDRRIPIPT